MAKRKDSVALFEVITATRKKQEAAARAAAAAAAAPPKPAAPKTPKWWFKKPKVSATANQDNAYSAPALPAPSYSPPQSTVPQLAAPEFDPTMTVSAPAIVQRVAPPEVLTIPEQRPQGDPFGLEIPSAAAPAPAKRSWFGRFAAQKPHGVDKNSRQVTLRFRYKTAIVAGFAACVLITVVIVATRQSGGGSARANGGASSAAVKRGPILAGVLDVRPSGKAVENTDDSNVEGDNSTGNTNTADKRNDSGDRESQSRKAPNALPTTAVGVETALPRAIGLNYVIIQSYPEEKMANDAQAALEAAGIPTTVQRAPSDYVPNSAWYSVIGTHGFPRISAPVFGEYMRKIEAVNENFAGKSKMKKFEPAAYKWKPTSLRAL